MVYMVLPQRIACCVFTHIPFLLVNVRYTPINVFYALLFQNTHNNNMIPYLILNTGRKEK